MLWVRSQDNLSLVKVIAVSVRKYNDERLIVGWVSTPATVNNSVILGEYSSEEKAVRVLDMLEKHLSLLMEGYPIGPFQMPADEEVEADETSAREMFEKLGYWRIINDDKCIVYSSENSPTCDIRFDKKHKHYKVDSHGLSESITPNEHAAIALQMKELGWF